MQLTAHAPDGTRWTIIREDPPMQVGLTTSAANYGTHRSSFPNAAFCRVFAGAGQGLPNLGAAPWPEWVSWKDPIQPAALDTWLDGVTRPTVVTYYHERDNNKGEIAQGKAARADYFARWRDLYAVVQAHRNRALVQAIPVQTLQWTQARSSTSAIKGDGDWRTWWPGVGDGVGIDCYVGSWESTYPDPATWLRIPLELAEGAGRPLWLPELGSVLLGSDTGAGRAAWIRDVIAVLRESGCAGVAWWCSLGKPGAKGEVRDFHLADKASAQAWQEAIDGSAT